MRSRLAASLVVLSLVLLACGGDDAEVATATSTSTTEEPTTTSSTEDPTTTTTEPEGDGPPPIVVVTGEGAELVDGGEASPFEVPDGTEVVHVVDDDLVVVQVSTVGSAEVRVLDGGEVRTLDLGSDPLLHDAGTIEGSPVALVTRDLGAEDEEPSAELVLVDLDDGSETVLGPARAPEYFVAWASFGADLVATSAFSDLTETIDVLDAATGQELDFPTPTNGLAYAEPPLVVAAVLSPDGERLAWADGPEVSSNPDAPVDDRPWQVLVSDVGGPGDVAVEIPGTGLDTQVARLDLADGWLVVTVEDVAAGGDGSLAATWLVDLSDPEAAPERLAVTGTATFAPR